MKVFEVDLRIPAICHSADPLEAAADSIASMLKPGQIANRFAITKSGPEMCDCDVGLIEGVDDTQRRRLGSAFEFRRRGPEDTSSFNVAFLVPTGVGSAIGGHAGDATPAVRLIGALCDRVILHPNVVNASDLNEMPDNALYVEGSVLTRLFMGVAGLQPVRANRILTVMDNHPDDDLREQTINTVNSARSTYGAECSTTVLLDPPVRLTSHYTSSGRASGVAENVGLLAEMLEDRRGSYDAVALATVVELPFSYHSRYFSSRGEMVNPWGGAEAILTHAVSTLFDVPAAHAPIDASQEVADIELGRVDPRMAAEAISYTYFQCVLKGLRQSPRIVRPDSTGWPAGTITSENISCLVIPDKCVGLPTLAALKQGIPVIAVRENTNILENDMSQLPWAPGQFFQVENYWEAAGVIAALRQGLDPYAARRPLTETAVEVYRASSNETTGQLLPK